MLLAPEGCRPLQTCSTLAYMDRDARMEALRSRAAGCTACALFKAATQTVFGEGPAPARLMLIGEQPGDREDLEGKPFVGPAGLLLDRALAQAGIDRQICYITHAVQHFKWEPRGKRRVHKTPAQREIEACRQWLEAETQLVQPALIVCLGATAAKAVLGAAFRVTRDHGRCVASNLGPPALATTHPSAVLRTLEHDERELAYGALVADLQAAAHWLKAHSRP
jgi:uracil-DNA glycosylase family protein